MRQYFYSPKAAENLSDFHLTKAGLFQINKQVARLAKNPLLGYQIPFQLSEGAKLYRYEVGGFKLNYVFDDKELSIVSVMV